MNEHITRKQFTEHLPDNTDICDIMCKIWNEHLTKINQCDDTISYGRNGIIGFYQTFTRKNMLAYLRDEGYMSIDTISTFNEFGLQRLWYIVSDDLKERAKKEELEKYRDIMPKEAGKQFFLVGCNKPDQSDEEIIMDEIEEESNKTIAEALTEFKENTTHITMFDYIKMSIAIVAIPAAIIGVPMFGIMAMYKLFTIILF